MVKTAFEISWFYWIYLIILSRKWGHVCENWSQRSGIMAGSKWSKCTFQVPGPKFNNIFEISWFYWIHLIILEKMRSCLWKFKQGFWTYGWILLLGPSGSNKCVVFRLQVLRSRQFLRFHDFIGFISSFMRKWGPVCENWSQGSRLMLWLDTSFGAKWLKYSF